MDIYDIGEAVRARRRELGYTQDRLARLSGISRPRISRLETGAAYDMRLRSIVAILDALDMSLRVSGTRDARPVYEDIRKESERDTPGLG